jgi:hypothetical protein
MFVHELQIVKRRARNADRDREFATWTAIGFRVRRQAFAKRSVRVAYPPRSSRDYHSGGNGARGDDGQGAPWSGTQGVIWEKRSRP